MRLFGCFKGSAEKLAVGISRPEIAKTGRRTVFKFTRGEQRLSSVLRNRASTSESLELITRYPPHITSDYLLHAASEAREGSEERPRFVSEKGVEWRCSVRALSVSLQTERHRVFEGTYMEREVAGKKKQGHVAFSQEVLERFRRSAFLSSVIEGVHA